MLTSKIHKLLDFYKMGFKVTGRSEVGDLETSIVEFNLSVSSGAA